MNLLLEWVLLLFLGNGFAIYGVHYKRYHQVDNVILKKLPVTICSGNSETSAYLRCQGYPWLVQYFY